MIKIRFNNSNDFLSVKFAMVTNHVVRITSPVDIHPETVGFRTYTEDEIQIGDFSEFKTIYRLLPNGVEFSDDGSVYVEPKIDILLTVSWEDEEAHPDQVALTLANGDVHVLTDEDNWEKKIIDIPASQEYLYRVMETEQVEGWLGSIVSYTTVIYNAIKPSVDERLDMIDAQVLYTALMTDTLIEE